MATVKKKCGRYIVTLEDGYVSFKFNDLTSNCKLSYLEGIQKCLDADKKETLEAIEEYFHKPFFFVHVIKTYYLDFLQEKFEMVYCMEVPIKSFGESQYHALFMYDTSYKNKLKERKVKQYLKYSTYV